MIALLLALLAAQPAPELPAVRPSGPPERRSIGTPEGPRAAAPVDSDGVEIAGASAGAVRVPSSERAWSGPRRVADYDLEAVLDTDKHTVEGKARLTWLNRSARPITHLYLHLYLNAFEGPGSTFMTEAKRYGGLRTGVELKSGEYGWMELRKVEQSGKPVPWKFVHPDSGPETDHSGVQLDLPA